MMLTGTWISLILRLMAASALSSVSPSGRLKAMARRHGRSGVIDAHRRRAGGEVAECRKRHHGLGGDADRRAGGGVSRARVGQ